MRLIEQVRPDVTSDDDWTAALDSAEEVLGNARALPFARVVALANARPKDPYGAVREWVGGIAP